jgi:hypothetical protein
MDDRERQLDWEQERRAKVALFAIAAGVLLFVGSAYGDYVVFAHYPTVGLLQGLTPAIEGIARAAADPRSAHVLFTAHHTGGLIFASLIVGAGSLSMIPVLRYVYAATAFRRPSALPVWKYFATIGGVVAAVFAVAIQTVDASKARDFARHADRSEHAVNQAITSSLHLTLSYPATAGQLALALAFGMISLNAMRAGLLTRLMGILGIVAAVLFEIPLPLEPLPIEQVVWLVGFGSLASGRTQSTLPPAWASGEAEPWMTQQQLREQRESGTAPRRPRGASQPLSVPAPRLPGTPSPNSSKKRKKRR